jgi:hypothetical protein
VAFCGKSSNFLGNRVNHQRFLVSTHDPAAVNQTPTSHTMKCFSLCIATLWLLVGCAASPYGKVSDPQKYDSLSGDFTEGFATIRATVLPSESTGGNVHLRTQNKKSIEANWPESLPAIATLDATKSYEFDLLIKHWHKPDRKTAEVFRIRDGQQILADLAECKRHQKTMHREVEDWIDAVDPRKAKRYPHSGIFHAVCSSGIRHVVWVCPSCQAAERKEVIRAQ